jgi:recombination protein RecA
MPAKPKTVMPPSTLSLAGFAAQMQGHYGDRVSNGPPPEIVSTGSLALDRALRVGGWQKGRVYEILGPEDSAKTTLMIASMVSFGADDPDRGYCYVNMEGTFSRKRATAMGLDCSNEALKSGRWAQLFPVDSEDASNMAGAYCQGGHYSVIVIDSIGAMESRRVLSKAAEEDTVMANAKVITQMNKKLATLARRRNCTILLVNQPRATPSSFGGDVSAGPKHMKHVTTVKITMRSLGDPDSGDIRKLRLPGDDEDVIVSQQFAARVGRMKNGVSGLTARFFANKIATDEYGPPGIDTAGEYLDVGVREGIVSLGGGWYNFPDGHKEQGRPAAGRYIRQNPEIGPMIRAAMKFESPEDDLELEDED